MLPALRVRSDEAVAEMPDRGCDDRRWIAAGESGADLPAPSSLVGKSAPFLRLALDDMPAEDGGIIARGINCVDEKGRINCGVLLYHQHGQSAYRVPCCSQQSAAAIWWSSRRRSSRQPRREGQRQRQGQRERRKRRSLWQRTTTPPTFSIRPGRGPRPRTQTAASWLLPTFLYRKPLGRAGKQVRTAATQACR